MSDHPTRLAKATDVPAIEALVEAAYGHYVERMGRTPAPMTADYAGLIEQEVVWVLELDGEVTGLAVLRQEPGHLLVSNVAVAPEHQGMGFGRALLAHAEAEARHAGLTELRLYTHELMHENISLYTKLGWVELDRAEHEGFRRVFMRRRLLPIDGKSLSESPIAAAR